jgi:hypothetical protein
MKFFGEDGPPVAMILHAPMCRADLDMLRNAVHAHLGYLPPMASEYDVPQGVVLLFSPKGRDRFFALCDAQHADDLSWFEGVPTLFTTDG